MTDKTIKPEVMGVNMWKPSVSYWGILLVLVGIYLLLKELGYIAFDLPFWPIVLILLGLYFIIARINR